MTEANKAGETAAEAVTETIEFIETLDWRYVALAFILGAALVVAIVAINNRPTPRAVGNNYEELQPPAYTPPVG